MSARSGKYTIEEKAREAAMKCRRHNTTVATVVLGRFCVLLVFSVAFGLICSEIPESLSLYDDTSNDFLVSGPAPKIGRVQTVREESSPRRSTAQRVTFPSISVSCFTQPALPSGQDLLRLLSIQRK
jgi:hypothetical protein